MHTKRWYQDWLGWVIVGSIVYGLICLLSLASDVGRPFPGFFTYHNMILSRMDMEWNTPSWWWNVAEEHPRLGDLLIQVEDVSFDRIVRPVEERTLYQTAWDNGQFVVDVTVLRNDQFITFPVPLKQFSMVHFIDLMLLPIIMATCYWLLAIILYRSAHNENKQRLVVLILCAIALIAIAIKGVLFGFGSVRENILFFINPPHSMAGTFIGALFLCLAFYFPYPRWPRLRRWILPTMFGIALLLYIFYVSAKIIVWQSWATPLAHWMDQTWFKGFQILIIIGIGCVLLRMLGEAASSRKSREREEARILLLAFLLFLPAVWFAIHGISGSNATILFLQSLADTRFLALVVPFAFAAISLRYHTFSGAETWLFFALVLAVSGFLANISVAVLFGHNPQMIRESPLPPTAVLFLFFLLIGLLWGWQSGWRGWLRRVFQWERVSYHEVLSYGRFLSTVSYSNQQQLAQCMADSLCASLGVGEAAVWLRENNKLNLAATSGLWANTPPPQIQLPDHMLTKSIRLSLPVEDWLASCYPTTTVILPLAQSGEIIGLLGVGARWDTAVFDDRDLEILDLIAQQSAILLQNTLQIVQLRQSDQQLLQIQEKTQQKTAQNLHDHALPALHHLQLKLLMVQQILDSSPDKAGTMLMESQTELAETTKLIRRIQKDLIVRPLVYGLSPYLQEMVQNFTHDTQIPVELYLPPELDKLIQDTELREVIYTVWQQAFNNVEYHAQASKVIALIKVDASQLTFSICDNGRGCLPEQQHEALQNGHFGLRSMQIRLESIGGQFSFESTLSQGSCVRGQIPLD